MHRLIFLQRLHARWHTLVSWQQRTFHDPITGDTLTAGEFISWRIQSIIRRWLFLGIITLVTIICWATHNDVILTWWNLSASYLALVIESIVGLAMFNQTKRDAVIIRHILTG